MKLRYEFNQYTLMVIDRSDDCSSAVKITAEIEGHDFNAEVGDNERLNCVGRKLDNLKTSSLTTNYKARQQGNTCEAEQTCEECEREAKAQSILKRRQTYGRSEGVQDRTQWPGKSDNPQARCH